MKKEFEDWLWGFIIGFLVSIPCTILVLGYGRILVDPNNFILYIIIFSLTSGLSFFWLSKTNKHKNRKPKKITSVIIGIIIIILLISPLLYIPVRYSLSDSALCLEEMAIINCEKEEMDFQYLQNRYGLSVFPRYFKCRDSINELYTRGLQGTTYVEKAGEDNREIMFDFTKEELNSCGVRR